MMAVFELTVQVDDVGVPTYFASIISSKSVLEDIPEDLDVYNLEGVGETQLDAISNLCIMLDDIIDDELQETIMTKMRELLAQSQHEAWSGWMEYLFENSNFDHETQTATIPADKVERWVRQLNTEYNDLSEEEKESDRKEADRIIEIVKEFANI